jgi:MFS transporter, ACS family, solute carrier family 17 (sodium-dependent inorganic phosphate cotransporter), other
VNRGTENNWNDFSVEMVPTVSNGTEIAINGSTTTTESPEIDTVKGTTFSWTEGEKQLILGSFFWGYILTELPGGRLAELIGGHRVFGHSSKFLNQQNSYSF